MRPTRPKDRQVNCKLDSELHDTLIETARQSDEPVSLVIRRALRSYLKLT